jgi:hypothetical protein
VLGAGNRFDCWLALDWRPDWRLGYTPHGHERCDNTDTAYESGNDNGRWGQSA